MNLSPAPDAPSRLRRAHARRTLLRVLLSLVLVLALAACQTAEQGPDGDTPSGPEWVPGEDPGTGDGGDDGSDGGDGGDGGDDGGDPAPPPNLSAVEVALVPVTAETEAGEPYEFIRPLGAVSDGSSDRLYVMQQGGRVDVLEDGVVRSQPFLDVSDRVLVMGEAGLLGLVFPPDYPERSVVFVHYTWQRGEFGEDGLWTTVSRLPVVDGSAVLEEETILFELEQPSSMHNGGQLAFGPDGMLYVAIGEGMTTPEDVDPYDPGPAGNPEAVGPESPLGTILRLDPEADGTADAAPADNPFADGVEGDPHVWAYGLRNPWRFSFDPVTGDLWLADVGESRVEEVNHVPADDPFEVRDFGWNAFEGDECLLDSCDGLETVDPVITYRTDDPNPRGSVTGGYVYRGDAIDHLAGAYVFGDYMRSTIWATAPANDYGLVELFVEDEGAADPIRISSFGVDSDGELVVVDYGNYDYRSGAKETDGGLYRLVPANPSGVSTAE